MSKRTIVSYAPGDDWLMVRRKKAMAAFKRRGRVCVAIWKFKTPREPLEGLELRLTPEEALDLAYALGFMAYEIDPNTKKKYARWIARGRHRLPDLRLIRGGLRREDPPPRT
jgi:hypothetical protein